MCNSKKLGHLSSKCRRHPQNRPASAYLPAVSPYDTSPASSSSDKTNKSPTSEMVSQNVQSSFSFAFSAMSFSGNSRLSSV